MNKTKTKRKYFSLKVLFVLSVFICFFVLNEKESQAVSELDIFKTCFTVKTSPEFPEAFSEIKAKVISACFNVDKSHFTWYQDGKIIAKGLGEKTATFKAGPIGSTLHLSVKIKTDEGRGTAKEKKIKIGAVDLLWRADTYTPEYYKGKALPAENSKVTFFAMTSGLGPKENLVYDWYKGINKVGSASGYGKDSFTLEFSDIFSTEEVYVEVSNLENSVFVREIIKIRRTNPTVVFYEENPLEGALSQKAITSYTVLEDPEITIKAEPFYYPLGDLGQFSYKWLMNSQEINPLYKSNVVGFEINQEGDEQGRANIKLKIEHPDRKFWEYEKNFGLYFLINNN